ncbi:MAG: hypothetical protein JRE16_12270 [Deltaproteobacteria bacterium]|nr:hypothetical protein [Deltaproteobacteria bacterium]
MASTGATPITAHTDDVPPIFYGLSAIEQHDEPGVVNLRWDAARDHTLPLEYRVWYTTYAMKTHLANGGELYDAVTDPNGSDLIECFTPGSPPTAVGDSPVGGSDYCIESAISTGNSAHLHDLATGDLYTFVARAYDGNGNHDHNTVVQMAMPVSAPTETVETQMYLVDSGGTQLLKQADLTNPIWPGAGSIALATNDTAVFQATNTLPRESIVTGLSFDIETDNSFRDTILVSAELGYIDGGFVRIGPLTNQNVQDSAVAMGKRVTRLQKFILADYLDYVAPAGFPLAIRIDRWDVSTNDLVLNFGTAATKGQLLVNVQPYNIPPHDTTRLEPAISPTYQLRTGGYIDIDWNAIATDSDGQAVHYDVFGSDDDGANYDYVLATNVSSTDDLNNGQWGRITWDTVGDGIVTAASLRVSVEAGDGFEFEDPSAPNYPDPLETSGATVWATHTKEDTGTIAIDNTQDQEPPAAVYVDSADVVRRPKQGTVYLEWLSVGNDGYNHGTRAVYYDLRYRNISNHGNLTAGNWSDANTIAAKGEPVPQFSGRKESFELVNLAPDSDYDLAIVTCDAGEDSIALNADDNCSGLSNVVTFTSGQYFCGLCHTTPPSEPDTAGTHMQHGFTLQDCAKCHGNGTSPDGNDVTTYDGRHYDGVINIGWAENDDGTRVTLNELTIGSGGSGVTITQTTNNNGPVTIYQDPDGAGGYNAGTAFNPSFPLQNTDSGKCINFGSGNVTGCHGPFQPKWTSDTVESQVTPECADCHGDKTMTVNDDAGTGLGRLTDPYGRQWDDVDTTQPQIEDPPSSGNFYYPPREEVMAAPPVDNHGQSSKSDRYTGAHLRHLNSSFRFAKQDSCRLCHKDTMESGLHANRHVDVVFDMVADKADLEPATYNSALADVETLGVSCSSLNNMYCHDTGSTPRWADPGAQCNSCHGMAGKTFDPVGNSSTIGHVFGSPGDVVDCVYCHVAGHPQSPDGVSSGDPNAMLINNNTAVGINYRSGGIHLRRTYDFGGGPVTFNTLAEICWGCHDQNQDGDLNDAGDINEFGPNTQAETGSSAYDYGYLNQKEWVGATWSSAYGQTSGDPFYYKRGLVQSIHTADASGSSAVSWDATNGRYNETASDTIAQIRCSNCHDLHDLNLADGDTSTGAPYLRGSWMGNPYEEDGAPYNKTYTGVGLGAVPRGGTGYTELGGYYIDQNNVVPGTGLTTQTAAPYPTSGWTVYSAAGLCVLCHDSDVDNMNKLVDEDPGTGGDQGLWLGTNGHSNAAIGGTGTHKTNIFDYSHGRVAPLNPSLGGTNTSGIVPDMGMQTRVADTLADGSVSKKYIYGYRSARASYLTPTVGGDFAYENYTMPTTVDGTSTDTLFHQFSCSKCHNPHASRLPKLMITNCLDVRHNTWDDANSSQQNTFTHANNDPVDRNMPAAYYGSAQNCHRFDPARGDTNNDNVYDNRDLRGGWNKVTPWVNNNLDNTEHKGSLDPAYGTSNATSPWQHSDFPQETSGW